MKKVFLSLAALAFVATGTVSCSSDDGGSTGGNDDVVNDDTPGGDDTPGEEQTPNTVDFNGEEFPLNGSYFELATRNYDLVDEAGQPTGETMEAPIIYNYPDGGYANVYYVNLGHIEGEEQNVYFYAAYLVQNPTIVIQNGSIADFGDLVLPHQAENIAFATAYGTINGTVVQSVEGNVGSGDLMINTLVLQGLEGISSYEELEVEGETDLVTTFAHGSNDLSFKYNGATALFTYNESEQEETSTSSVNSSSMGVKKQLLSGFESLDINVIRK